MVRTPLIVRIGPAPTIGCVDADFEELPAFASRARGSSHAAMAAIRLYESVDGITARCSQTFCILG